MLLKQFTGRASAVLAAPAPDVFAALTNVARLPQWNQRVAKVRQAPPEPLDVGSEWVVQMRVPPAKWPSRATCTAYDARVLHFAHRSVSDDGNPSYVLWAWQVTPAPGGSQVDVRWEAHPNTFWRQALFAKMRRRQLDSEVEASLRALAYHLAGARTG